MTNQDMKWQGGIMLGFVAFIVTALLAIDLGGGRRRAMTDQLFDGLLQGHHVESELWLWVARGLAIITLVALAFYMLVVKRKAARANA